MFLSKYYKIYPSIQNASKVLLFSTKTAAIMEIPKSMLRELLNGDLAKEDRKLLTQAGFLVKDPEKEKQEMLGYVDDLNRLNRTLNIRLVMNLDCNLACRYCFEGKRKGRHYMSRETADELVSFVGREAVKKKELKEIGITFYGGEPLLSRELIIYISKKMKSLTAANGLSFHSYIITNGTLLTKDTVKTLKPLGLKKAYIAIDGLKDNHNLFRPYKTGKGSFDAILKNIREIGKSIKIQTGGNFSKDNFKKFPKLLDYLSESGLPPSKLPVIGFFPIIAESAEFKLPDFNDGCASLNEPWLIRANLFLREEILKRGHKLLSVGPGPCAMEFENSLIINYEGSIYKCPGLIGRKKFRIGTLWTGIRDYRKSHRLDNWKNEECLECSYLPLCLGGCRHVKLVRDGDIDGVDCKKPYLDATLEKLIKQDIKYGMIKA